MHLFTVAAFGLPLCVHIRAALNFEDKSLDKRDSVIISIPVKAPSSAKTLDRSLVSFSIEADRWPDWAGLDSANTFFRNLLINIGTLSGRMPEMRVGADSEDRITLDETVGSDAFRPRYPAYTNTTPYPEAYDNRVSSKFFELSKWMPRGTHMIWGLNLGTGNISNAVAEMKDIAKTFGPGGESRRAGVILDAIEIGNEADFFRGNGDRPSTYGPAEFQADWTNYSLAAIGAGAPRIWLGGFAGTDHGAGGFSPQQLYKQNVLTGPIGKYIDTFSGHHYSGSFCQGNGGLLSALMAKPGVRSNISYFDPDIQATVANGLTYVLGETNSYACHGAPGVSNVAGAAIWGLDYLLQAATHDIRRVYFHMGVGYKYSLVQPVALNRSIIDGSPLQTPIPAHIQPQYYAGIIAAALIGSSPGSMTISELTVNNDHIAGYAAFNNDKLVRAVFLNSQAYLTSTTTGRQSVSLVLSASGGASPKRMKLQRLKIHYADDTAGVTFGGRSYETSNGLPTGSTVSETVEFTDPLTISDTEAILVEFQS